MRWLPHERGTRRSDTYANSTTAIQVARYTWALVDMKHVARARALFRLIHAVTDAVESEVPGYSTIQESALTLDFGLVLG